MPTFNGRIGMGMAAGCFALRRSSIAFAALSVRSVTFLILSECTSALEAREARDFQFSLPSLISLLFFL